MMESVKVASYLRCFCLWSLVLTAETSSSVRPASGLVFVNVGDNMTLQCSFKGESMTAFHWYKQVLGEKPSLIFIVSKYDSNVRVSKEFQNNHRFSVNLTQHSCRLTIANLSISDSATYSCVSSDYFLFEVDEIYIVHVSSLHLNAPVDVHQSPSEVLRSGDSVTLNCTVHTGTCDEEHTVYWFRSSGGSEPDLIYAHGARNDHCERKNNNCIYNLSMKNTISKAGTYYCAVTSCGRLLFGGEIKLENENDEDSHVLVDFLCGASAFSTFLALFLAFSVCVMNSRCSCTREEHDERLPPQSRPKDCPDDDSLFWEKLKKTEKTWTECVYFNMKRS